MYLHLLVALFVVVVAWLWWKKKATTSADVVAAARPNAARVREPQREPEPRTAIMFTTHQRGVDTEWQHLMATCSDPYLTLVAVTDKNKDVFAKHGVATGMCPTAIMLDASGAVQDTLREGQSYSSFLNLI